MDVPALSTPPPSPAARDPALWAASQALEATFIEEMLSSAGLGAPRSGFGGGAGEEQFGGFLTGQYARRVSENGGFGLAESIYRALAAEAP